MARTAKEGLNYFPVWEPQFFNRSKFYDNNFKIRYKKLRNSSSGFIRREDVRNFLLKKYDNKCSICGDQNHLQIDHITSVYSVAISMVGIETLNSVENLRVVCRSCNSGRNP